MSQPTPDALNTIPQPASNTVGLYAVQCSNCFQWRLISDEDEYEKIRCNLVKEPFICCKKPNVCCEDPADIVQDTSRTWVLDKPSIPRTPRGFKRKLVLRRDFSKMDAHYVSPTGKKLRSSLECGRFLLENPDIIGVRPEDFSFKVPKIVEETIPKDALERKASTKGEKEGKD